MGDEVENRPFVPPHLDPKVLKGPALISSEFATAFTNSEGSSLSPKAVNACKLKATVIHFYMLRDQKNRREYRIEGRPSVFDLAYGEYESTFLDTLNTPMEDRWCFRWFHLPANNVCWMDY